MKDGDDDAAQAKGVGTTGSKKWLRDKVPNSCSGGLEIKSRLGKSWAFLSNQLKCWLGIARTFNGGNILYVNISTTKIEYSAKLPPLEKNTYNITAS